MKVVIEPTWHKRLAGEFEKGYFSKLTSFVRQAYQTKMIYPAGKDIFNAFNLCPFDRVKVVILGQDPYHGRNQAHGLCFSVGESIVIPPSLANIFQELKDDVGKDLPEHGNLSHWAAQGVLLLNATLTVEARKAGSHQHRGWEIFTDAVIRSISDEKENVVFMLWGSYAQKKGAIVDRKRHLVLSSPHPSPFSAHRGFFGNKHFSQTNTYLVTHGQEAITW